MTFDITKIDDEVRSKFSRIHDKYYYIGITKQEPQDRWNEHLYSFKVGNHHNHFLNSIYNNVNELYIQIYNKEFFNDFKNGIIKFEVVATLDSNLTEAEIRIYEAFEVKKIEHQLRVKNKEKFIYTLHNKTIEKDLCFVGNEMICNVQHSVINTIVKKEIDRNEKSLDIGSI